MLARLRKVTDMKKLLIFALPAVLGGCVTSAQLSSYTSAVNATTTLFKQVGQDIVTFDCANANLIYVIAKDANASARVQATLAKNAQIAKDACPLLTGNPAIVVQTGTVIVG
jgi:hypothetical protein